MLQWMGGSRRKVNASRNSTQKRQKQYFQQRKRQQQMMGSDNFSDSPDTNGQNLKEHRSLDILNLLNLSTNAQKCSSSHLKGRDDGENNISTMPCSISTKQPSMFTYIDTNVDSFRFEEARADSRCQVETSPEKVLVSSPGYPNTAFNGPSSHRKTVADQYSELSVIDLLCDDEANATVEKSPTCEDHVSFSLEGLGKVGTETPVHSPDQRARIPYSYTPLPKDGRKSKLKNLKHFVDDIELEVDTMMQDIKASPISSSNFPFYKGKQSIAIEGENKHFYNHTKKNSSSITEEFFHKTENTNVDIWNDSSSFLDEKFGNEETYDTSWKKSFQMGSRSPEVFKSGAYKMASYDFEDILPKKWSSAAAMNEINMDEPLPSFSKDRLENDLDFYIARSARCSTSNGKFSAKNLVPEDVRESSSLLSDESSASTALRGEVIKHSPSRIGLTGENRRKQRDIFVSPTNKRSTKDENRRSMSNPSKRKSSHHSDSILQEELGANNSWQFEERYASVDRSSVSTSFCEDLEVNFASFPSKIRTEDPCTVFANPELHNKAGPATSGFKNAAPHSDSPHSAACNFASEKFAFACSTAFPNVWSRPTSPSLSTDFELIGKPQDTGGVLCETSSTGMSVQGSLSKIERKVKSQKERCKSLEQEDIFTGDHELFPNMKMAGDASTSNNKTQECDGTEDTNPKTTQCLENTDSPSHVEEISSSLKKADKHENQVEKRKSNYDAETPRKFKITEEEKINWEQGRNTMNDKHNNEQTSLSGKVMFESYVFQLLCVQKVLKETCTPSRRNNAFVESGSNAITHQT